MKKLLNGNEALAYGAIAYGLDIFAGYPITPSTDIYEVLEVELEKYGGKFLHAESEISAINMVMGAYAAGKRAMTCTSGCGFSLMQETISYMAADFCPAVIVNVMREGAGLGDIKRSQGDYWQMTKGGGNGDYRSIVISCESIEDCMNAPKNAFYLAEKYRNPVIITYDSDIAHTKESVELPDLTKIEKISNLEYAITGNKNGLHKVFQNVYYHEKNYDEILKNKYVEIEEKEQKWKSVNIEKAKIVIVAYGICARICEEVINDLKNENNFDVGLIILKTLYPFPYQAFKNLKSNLLITVELNILKQMREDVMIATNCKIKTIGYGKVSTCPTVKEIKDFIKNIEV